MGLHDVVLTMHSLLRWGVLLAGLVVFGRTLFLRRGQPWSAGDAGALRAFVGLFDAQVLLGLVMYFGTSVLGVRMLAHAAIAMKDHTLRFFAVEHIIGMLAAAAVLHVGSLRLRRLGEAPERQTKTAVLVGVAFVIVFFSIPWPFFPYGRPLFRLGFT